MKKISQLILSNTKEFKIIHPMQIARAIHVLVDEGLIIISEKGSRKKTDRRSNCYIIVNPVPPCPGKPINKNR